MGTTVVEKIIGSAPSDYAKLADWGTANPKNYTLNVSGSTQAGSTNQAIVLDAAASSTAGDYVGNVLTIGSETRLITAYDATTKTATVGAFVGGTATFDSAYRATVSTPNDGGATFSNVPAAGSAYTIGPVIWRGKLKKERHTTGVAMHNKTASQTAYPHLMAVAGASIAEDPNFANNPMRYDWTKSAAIESLTGAIMIDSNIQYFRLTGIQAAGGLTGTVNLTPLNFAGDFVTVEGCIVEANTSNTSVFGALKMSGGWLVNSYVFQRSASTAQVIATLTSGVKVINSVLLAVAGTLPYGVKNNYVAPTYKNAYIGGVDAVDDGVLVNTKQGGCYTSGTQTGWTTVPFTTANFKSVATDGTHDARLVANSALIDVGVTDATFGLTDIGGRARPSGSAWDIGAWEYSPPAAAPVSFSGPVPTRNGAVGTAASFANAGFFSGTATPFTYSLQAGTLPAGLTLNASTGIIGGTPTATGTQSGIVVRATDANSATADTNAYSIVIAASNSAPTFPGVISNITGTAGTAITPVNTSGQFSDTDALTYSASSAGTAWPSGLTVNSSTGVISGTVAAASTTTGLKVRATDTASQTVDSNAFSVTISAPAQASFKSAPIENNAGQLVAAGTVIAWEWRQARVGTSGTVTYGSATAAADHTITATGMPASTGALIGAKIGATWGEDVIVYQTGTAA